MRTYDVRLTLEEPALFKSAGYTVLNDYFYNNYHNIILKSPQSIPPPHNKLNKILFIKKFLKILWEDEGDHGIKNDIVG